MLPLAAPVNPSVRASVKVGCSKCYGVLFVGPAVEGKLYCQACKIFTRATVKV